MTIIVGIDMHVKNLVCEIGYGKDNPYKKTFINDLGGHKALFTSIESLKKKYNTEDVLIGYEASGLGYVLYDRAIDEGYRCVVLAPTELLRSATGYKKKTDKKDASYIYETLRGHVLAGNRLNNIWIPDKELREERDLLRTWFDISTKIASVKIQIQTLLKKYGLKRPDNMESWTKAFITWLIYEREHKGRGFQVSLDSLLRQLEFLSAESKLIEKEVKELSQTSRYKTMCDALLEIKGVGLKTAMVFITELGDMKRFQNRRQVGSFIGLVPSTFESGDASDRKGRITRNGPYRVRSILNQALWVHLRYYGQERELYDKIVAKNPKRKKKAVVACMRRLAIRMWHVAHDAENEYLKVA